MKIKVDYYGDVYYVNDSKDLFELLEKIYSEGFDAGYNSGCEEVASLWEADEGRCALPSDYPR